MIVVQNCPHAPGLIWRWHTPQMAPQLMGEHYLSRTLLWSCFSNNHNNRTLFSTECGATSYLKPKPSLTHDCVYQPSHRTAQSTMGPASFHQPQDSSWTLDTHGHLSLYVGWQMHKANQVRFGLMGPNIVMNLYFICKLIFLSNQLSFPV